jgi:quercetin dioxygenase-like cupin family protein
MSPSHAVRRARDARYVVPQGYELHTEGFRRWAAVDDEAGAVHTGFGLGEMDPGGSVAPHVHSYEETLFVLEGEVALRTTEAAVLMGPGDYGLIPLGVTHALRNQSGAPCRWGSLAAPRPRPTYGGDTFFGVELPQADPIAVDPRDPRTRSFGHIDPDNMDVDKQTQDKLLLSASMRTALLAYSGITVKMMSDSDLGAQLSTMFMVQYEPDGVAGPHDHPLEETYLILEGETDATFDGQQYRLGVGDVAWAGVGCVHGFTNPGPGIVRWLETQAPQPPRRHSYRFERDWSYLKGVLE